MFEVRFDWSLCGESTILVDAKSKKEAVEIFLRCGGPKIQLNKLEPTAIFVENPTAEPFFTALLVPEAGDDDEIVTDTEYTPPEIQEGYE